MVAEKNIFNADKRYLPRWQVSNRVLFQLENDKQTHETTSHDISCTGACFASAKPIPVNKKIKIKIYLSSETVVAVEGQTVWSRLEDNQNLVGVIFSNTSQKAQELILKHAFEIKKEDMIKYWFQGWNIK